MLYKYLTKKLHRIFWKMNIPLLRSRFCNLDAAQMQFVNKIAYIVSNPLHFPREMTKVLDHLYLGNFQDAVNVNKLKEEGITHIVNTVENCHGHCVSGEEFYGKEFVYYGFTSNDEEKYPIMNHFEETYKFIESAREVNGKCLIHCIAGINRSGSLATAYVMLHKQIGPISAATLVFNARGILLSNNGFIERLVKLAVDKNMLIKDAGKL